MICLMIQEDRGRETQFSECHLPLLDRHCNWNACKVAFPERCPVYPAPGASRGRRRWMQRAIHGCSPWTVNHCRGEMLLCFAKETMAQAALLRWAQLNHKQASWCFNEGVFASAKNRLYPLLLQPTGLVSAYHIIFLLLLFFSVLLLQVSDLVKLQCINAETFFIIIIINP